MLQTLYQAVPVVNADPQIRHRIIITHATYSPWANDDDFIRTHQVIRNQTLVDQLRCYQLWHLAAQVASLPGAAIEVGTWRGGTGCLIAARLRDRPVYLCDTFQGVVKASDKDSTYRGGEHADAESRMVEDLAARLGLTDVRILQGIFPEETADAVAGERFCFCHIDVDTYGSARDVFEWVWPRLPAGGVVVFDDYGFTRCEGVTRLVNELAQAQDRRFVYNLSGQAILVKTADG